MMGTIIIPVLWNEEAETWKVLRQLAEFDPDPDLGLQSQAPNPKGLPFLSQSQIFS